MTRTWRRAASIFARSNLAVEVSEFLAITHADPTPTILARTDGSIVAANPSAVIALGSSSAINLKDVCLDAPERLDAFLVSCSSTRDAVFGSLTLRDNQGAARRYRCDGALCWEDQRAKG